MALRDGTWTTAFTDMVGSTEQRARLGDDIWDELRREHDRIVATATAEHSGEVVKGTGDGTLIAFTGAADALAATVAIQQGIDRRNRDAIEPLSVRIGVSLGDARCEDGDLHGIAIVEAARICALAEGGQILCNDIVRAVAGSRTSLAFEDFGAHELKGLSAPIPIAAVQWEPLDIDAAHSSFAVPPQLEPGTRVRFVGRDAEFDALMTIWKQAKEGERGVALVSGEPGIGKSRTAMEVAAEAREHGAITLYGRCDDELGVPYQPFVEALGWYVDHAGDPGNRLGRHGGELVRLVPELGERVRSLAQPLRSDPETEQYRLFEAVASWLASLSSVTPVVLVLDDMHWAAKPTLLMLRHLLQSPETMHLLVICTYRDTDLSRSHPLSEALADFRRQPGVFRFALSGLDAAGVIDVLESTAGHKLDAGGRALAGAIHAETEGNPFFVGEVLRHLAETGRIYERDGRWVTDDPSNIGIPEGVREVIGHRLNRLSGTTNEILSVAGVVGRTFEFAVVLELSELDEDVLLEALDEAIEARLIQDLGRGQYQFSHALVRSALYDEVRPTRRARMHQRVGEAIERLHANALDRHVGELAHHFAAAASADPRKALEYCRRAGEHALEQRAPDEAFAYFEQTLEMLDDDPDLDQNARGAMLLGLGTAQRRAGIAGYRETLLEAARLAVQQDDTELLVAAALANTRGFFSAVGLVDEERVAVTRRALDVLGGGDTTARARLLANLGVELVFGAPLDERRKISDEAVAVARRLDDPATTVQVLINRAIAILHVSTVEERLELTAEMLATARELDDPFLAFWSAYYRMYACLEAGLGDDVLARAADLADLAPQCGHASVEWVELLGAAGVRDLQAENDAVEDLASLQLDVGQRAGHVDAPFFFGVLLFMVRRRQARLDEIIDVVGSAAASVEGLVGIRIMEAIALAELDRLEEARALLHEVAAADFVDIPRTQITSSLLWGCAFVAARTEAGAHAERLLALLSPFDDWLVYNGLCAFGSIAAILGFLAASLGRPDEAETWFAKGADIEERAGAPASLAQTRTWWAAALLRRGLGDDAERATELLDHVRPVVEALDLASVRAQVHALES